MQQNVTDTFIRTFLKIDEVTEGLNIIALPYEIDDRLHMDLKDDFSSKAAAFEEIYNLIKAYKIAKTLKK